MTAELKRTPVYESHKQLGGRLIPFAGWEMPVQYSSILEEHAAVRDRAGLFDVSHMGQIHLSGRTAISSAEHLLTCPVASLRVGSVRYGLLCNPEGGVIDDVTVYRVAEHEIFLCVNAANVDRDREWVAEHSEGAQVEDRSEQTGLLALQGPLAATVLAGLCDEDPASLGRFRFRSARLAGTETLLSNTGYTGSPGFEIYLAADRTQALFTALLEAGREHGVLPAGLGARDTLRLEAALPLYGHELTEELSPLQAGLERFVKREAGGFIGAQAIERRAAEGHSAVLVGFVLEDRGIAREGHAITRDGAPVGRVTSGGHSPSLGRSIGLGYVTPELTAKGEALSIDVRGRSLAARVVETPFVKRRPDRKRGS